MITGLSSPGSHTSSRRLARPQTAMSVIPRSASARTAASTWPGPPSLLHGPSPGAQIAGPLRLVQRESLGRVPGDGLEQRPLVAALGHPERAPAAPACGEPLLDGFGVGWQLGHENLARHGLAVCLGAPGGTH